MSAAHTPTPETRAKVQSLSQFGIPQDQIAGSLDISAPTLRKHYAPEIAAGKLAANRTVAQNLFAFASGTKGGHSQQLTAAIFWAKTQMGFRETIDVNHGIDADGAAARLLAAVGKQLAAFDTALSSAPEPVAEPPAERLN